MDKFMGTKGRWVHDTDWELYEKDGYSRITSGIGYFDIYSDKPSGFCISGCISDADAKLIAASPELLEALKYLINCNEVMRFKSELPDALEKAKEVYNKALGL
jgi:hypothetical protein